MERLWIRVRVIAYLRVGCLIVFTAATAGIHGLVPGKNRCGNVHGCSSIQCASSVYIRVPSRRSVLNSLPDDLGDVGSQAAQGLLAALDRVVPLDRLVAQLLGGEHRAHL